MISEELQVLKIVTERLHKAKILYMISGSMASNYYSIPRMTRDIDIVIELAKLDVERFIKLFQKDFYIDEQVVKDELKIQGMFNVIHNKFVIKVDFIYRKSSDFQDSTFKRRKKVMIEHVPMYFISVEDLVLAKLLWARDSLSELQLNDVRNLLKLVKNLEIAYIDEWVHKLNIRDIYKKVK